MKAKEEWKRWKRWSRVERFFSDLKNPGFFLDYFERNLGEKP
jgi:hypothetical protein